MRTMKYLLGLGALAAVLAPVNLLASPVPAPCAYGTIASYVSAYPGLNPSCEVAGLAYKLFDFTDLTTGGGSHSEFDFFLTPNLTTKGLDLSIPNDSYSNEKYYFSYIVDPAPILEGEGISLDSGFDSSASFRGFAALFSVPSVLVTKWACPLGLLPGTPDLSGPLGPSSMTCASLDEDVSEPLFLQVGPGETDSGLFPNPVFFTHVGVLIELDGNVPALTASTYPQTTVPEPSSAALLGAGLAGLLYLRRRR